MPDREPFAVRALSRRTFLTAGIAGGAALVLARWFAARDSPRDVDAQRFEWLDAPAREIVAAIVPVMLAGALPTLGPDVLSARDEVVAGVDRAIAGLPPAVRKEIGELFALLDFAPTRSLIAGIWSRWERAPAADIAAFLDTWRDSRFALLRSGYAALHQLVDAAWYGNPRAWQAIGYSGPPSLGTALSVKTLQRSPLPDPVREGVAAGWKVIDASTLTEDRTLEADVVIVGTGAGGGTAAEIFAKAGLSVVMIEEGPLATSSDFRMREAEAYPQLYQESAARKSADKAFTILQGRCVGGGTTVNWTSSFRTPARTLEHWAAWWGVDGLSEAQLAPWFQRMEERLNITAWPVPPNENNDVLRRGAQALGIPTGAIQRNVKGCWNLGYCGMGCPTNAKQSMLVTTIPAALAHGATLVTRARAWTLEREAGRITALTCIGLDARGTEPTARRITVRARTFVSAAGAIGTPALLLRSRVPDPHRLVGTRTFLHPTLVSAALMPDRVDGFSGAPQTIYSDHFLDSLALDGPMGYKLEAPPIHPILASITLPGYGEAHAEWMRELPHMQVVIALLRDGFHPDSAGGRVRLQSDQTPVLDYPLKDYLWDGARRALLSMAEIQFAAGARRVLPVHASGVSFNDWREAKAAIAALRMQPLTAPLFSAHVMGGCALGSDETLAVVDLKGRYRHLDNLYVLDGSLFPTSIGANPQLSIYGLSAKLATELLPTLAH